MTDMRKFPEHPRYHQPTAEEQRAMSAWWGTLSLDGISEEAYRRMRDYILTTTDRIDIYMAQTLHPAFVSAVLLALKDSRELTAGYYVLRGAVTTFDSQTLRHDKDVMPSVHVLDEMRRAFSTQTVSTVMPWPEFITNVVRIAHELADASTHDAGTAPAESN